MLWANQDEIQEKWKAETLCPNCGVAVCYFLCPNSPHYYSEEREREDTLWQDSLSESEWMAMAVRQYEAVHGEAWCS